MKNSTSRALLLTTWVIAASIFGLASKANAQAANQYTDVTVKDAFIAAEMDARSANPPYSVHFWIQAGYETTKGKNGETTINSNPELDVVTSLINMPATKATPQHIELTRQFNIGDKIVAMSSLPGNGKEPISKTRARIQILETEPKQKLTVVNCATDITNSFPDDKEANESYLKISDCREEQPFMPISLMFEGDKDTHATAADVFKSNKSEVTGKALPSETLRQKAIHSLKDLRTKFLQAVFLRGKQI